MSRHSRKPQFRDTAWWLRRALVIRHGSPRRRMWRFGQAVACFAYGVTNRPNVYFRVVNVVDRLLTGGE